MSSSTPTPGEDDVPGGWPETPAMTSIQQPLAGDGTSHSASARTPDLAAGNSQDSSSGEMVETHSATALPPAAAAAAIGESDSGVPSSDSTIAAPMEEQERSVQVQGPSTAQERVEDPSDDEERAEFEKIKTNTSARRPHLQQSVSKRPMTEEDVLRVLSRKRTANSSVGRAETHDADEEQEEINKLLSRIFGRTRQANSEEEKTRHVGLAFKNLTVKGMGLGAALQPTTGDIFLNLPRFIMNLFKQGPSKAAGKPPVRTILNNFSGSIRPGEMLLVLGRPGSGCSTFLKVLANQRFGYEEVLGEVTYGGTDWKTMMKRYRGEILYNPEDDLHYATLKVKDTLKFALETKTPGKESRVEGESRKSYVQTFLNTVSKLFWIEHTMTTKVGDAFVRGVSGGEKKRVSIAEAMITKASTQCWDNSTRGLDASTALEYVQSLRALTNMAHISTAVALYQAGESLYDCFDKVILIEEGQCCYYGTTEDAADYFKSLGFVQPERWTTADFLTSVTDEHERHVRPGWEDRIPRSAAQFGEVFRKSEHFERNKADIAAFEAENQARIQQRHDAQSKATRKKNFTIPFHKQVIACTKRQFLVMLGDQQSLFGKWGGILFQALITGSLFFDMPKTSSGVFTRGGVMFYMLLFNALLALAELTSAFQSKPILLKHKSFSFYRPAAYAIAQTVCDVPLVFIQVTIFDLVVYFMSNLQRTVSQFFVSLLLLFLISMTMYAFFRSLGALMGSLDAATRITGVAIQALIVYTGYLIPPRKMHPWFSWLRWINPVQYAFEGLMANEFHNLDLQCDSLYTIPQGPNTSPQYQSCAVQGSQPGTTTVHGADYIDVAFGYSYSHLWRNVGFISAFFLFFVALTAIGMEIQKPNKGGGAVTIYRRGQVPKDVGKAMEQGRELRDEETGKEYGSGTEDSKNGNGSSDEDTVQGVAKNESIFTWQNVNYSIPYEGGERQLLRDVQGVVKPGKLTALMGASGAGKTTLLNTLAQRIRFGIVTGDFLVDGGRLPKAFQRATGFAEQSDIHEPTASVREALRFSAKLRQPKEVPLQEKYDYCEKIIDLLEMREIAGATIGQIGSGLNQEQRKRLTIAVELASKPELLIFLDEPTSGLDSGAAFNIVRFLRKLANAGQAILCTIHQPSSVLFEHFDTLLLLESGGRTVYFGDLGPDSRTLLDYMEGNGAKKCPPQGNPAEYMLEAIGAGNPDYKGQDWGDVWDRSPEKEALSNEVRRLSDERRNVSKTAQTDDDREFAMPLMTQLSTVINRSFTAMWRSPEYVIGKFMLHIFTGLFNSFTFYQLGNSQIDMQSRLFSIFMTLTICPPLIQQLQPRFMNARSLYESREASSKIYSWTAFATGSVLVELPISLLAGTAYWVCWYWPAGFPSDTYTAAGVWAYMMMFELYYVGFGQAIAAFSPNELLASLLVPIFFTFVISFCGVVVPFAALSDFWRSWMYYFTPFTYVVEGFLALLTHGLPIECDSTEIVRFNHPPGINCSEYAGRFAQMAGGYVEELQGGDCGFCQFATGDAFTASFNIYFTNVWRDYGIFAAYTIFNFFIVFACSWLYLQGGRQILQTLSPKVRKEKKAMKERERAHEEKV